MFAVVFEVHPAGPAQKDEYLSYAKHLKPLLESIDGFIDNERFESKRRPGWMLSLSTWRDEKSVVRWRSEGEHHKIQHKGRGGIFADYHLRVCEVTADSQPPKGMSLIEQRLDFTETGEAKALAITEVTPAANATIAESADRLCALLGLDVKNPGLVDYDAFESIYNAGKMLLLTGWKTPDDAARWVPGELNDVSQVRHRRLRAVRDYGMFDRREAPQYFPEARKT